MVGKDPYDSRYIYVVWRGIEGTIFNSGFQEVKNVPEFKGKSYHGYNSYGDTLNFRAKDWNTKIGEVPKYADFYVLGESVDNSNRLVVIWDQKIGTVMKGGVSKVTNGVFVNKKDQMVNLYRNSKFVSNSPCITGEEGKADTPIGRFAIKYMEMDRTLRGTNWKGEEYASPVKYWMPFYGGYGLHDASWCSEFGGDLYQNGGGSNGCVRLPSSFARKVFSNAYSGMRVYVW